MNKEKRERMLELLADEAVFGLSEEEISELQQLKNQIPEWENDASFELTAAKIGLINLDISKSMPENLRTNILADAENFFSADENQTVTNFEQPGRNTDLTEKSGFSPFSSSFWQWLGWAAAATACIALAINLWTTRFYQQPEIVKNTETIQTPTPQLSVAQKREQLLANAADVIKTEWKSPTGEDNISGDVVWSNSQQKGFLRFRGMPVNNPNKETYQLWIFDEAQNEKYPIDGGVFDVNESGEVIVPIDPAINVKKPTMFAVTAEKPGGVVVSSREKLLAIAKI